MSSTFDATTLSTLSSIAALGIAAFTLLRLATGKGGERQIEPTQLASISDQLSEQRDMLSRINREVGEVKTRVQVIGDDLTGLHQRMGGISRELSATTARVDGLEKREGNA